MKSAPVEVKGINPNTHYPYNQLSALARTYIALSVHHCMDDEEIAEYLQLDEKEMRAFVRKIRNSREAMHLMKHGIPACFGEKLFGNKSVVCPRCKNEICHVPCVQCCDHTDFMEDEDNWQPDKLPKLPTRHPPGSRGKIEMMRKRIARNEHLHHPNDAPIPE